MKLKLTVTEGPHQGREFTFDGHDTFLVGRAKDAHLQLSYDDPYFSRRHFVVEIHPPRCRVLDLKSRNGTKVNGQPAQATDLRDGDLISAGHTVFRVSVHELTQEPANTLDAIEEADEPVGPTMAQSGRPMIESVVPRAFSDLEKLRIPGYELAEELGRGAMGIVRRATRLSDGREVAIKTVIPVSSVSRKQINRFLRECRILGSMAHANIVRFYDCGDVEGVIYLVMELINGTDAERVLLEKGALEIRTAVRLICQMLGGLAHAHAKGFVHRDLKPSNILIASVNHKRQAKLADFGLARVYESSKLSGLTMQGEVGGTPAFMAPEQVTHYREVMPPADQYSAAATLYRLLTRCYSHDLPLGVSDALVHLTTEPPIPIRNRRDDIPLELAAAIHKAMSREPSDRFADVKAFRKALLPFAE